VSDAFFFPIDIHDINEDDSKEKPSKFKVSDHDVHNACLNKPTNKFK